ncbi:hypothetical protein MUK42_00070 [Musa troglodytarum]|uniref:Uncharacterized protein n=1 Tax=Musa troglodytarum TaxID=320322 RepID=A0A9E7FGG6_9LILI|nr:hypothetical protein MUK42_00070 [Musa troglodytarum]
MGRTLTRSDPPPLLPLGAPSPSRPAGGPFTAAELAAAAQLLQLSESSSADLAASSSSSSSSSSPRSVNNRPPPEAVLLEAEEEEEEEETGLRRRTKRYRLIADLHMATAPVDGCGKREGAGSGRACCGEYLTWLGAQMVIAFVLNSRKNKRSTTTRRGTSLVYHIQGAMNNVMELQRIFSLHEALQILQIVLWIVNRLNPSDQEPAHTL